GLSLTSVSVAGAYPLRQVGAVASPAATRPRGRSRAGAQGHGVELASERAIRAEPRKPLLDALELGAWHGAWTIAVGAVPAAAAYALRYGFLDLPWVSLAAQLGTFVAVTGALYGGGIALGDALARTAPIPSGARPVVHIAAPAISGALFGLAPGAFAAEQFGRISAPYFGTIEILIVGVLAFFLLGATLLRA